MGKLLCYHAALLFRDWRKPLLLAALLVAYLVVVCRHIPSSNEALLAQRWDGRSPETVSESLLGEGRGDLNHTQIYQLYIRRESGAWLAMALSASLVPTLALGTALAAVVAGPCHWQRRFGRMAARGFSRSASYCSALLACLLPGLALCGLGMAASLTFRGVHLSLVEGEARMLAAWLASTAALLSVPLCLTLSLQRPLAGLGGGCAVFVLAFILEAVGVGLPCLRTDWNGWLPTAAARPFLTDIWLGCCLTVALAALGWLAFRRKELD